VRSTGDSAIEARCQHAGQSVRSASRFVALPLRFFGGAPNYRAIPAPSSPEVIGPHCPQPRDSMRRRPPEATGEPSGCGLARSLIRGLCPKKPEEVDAGREETASRVEEDTMEQDKGDKGGEQKGKVTFKKWWRDARPTKTVVFWSWIGSVVLTIRIGENRFVEAK